jgi:hypothetical protein
MDYTGRSVSNKRKLVVDDVSTKKLCIRDQYCLPETPGTTGQVITAGTGTNTSWVDQASSTVPDLQQVYDTSTAVQLTTTATNPTLELQQGPTSGTFLDIKRAAGASMLQVDETKVQVISLQTNSINEQTSGTGVTIDSVLVKDGKVDGVDVSAFKTSYDTNVNQDVKFGAGPTFNGITCIGQSTFQDNSASNLQMSLRSQNDLGPGAGNPIFDFSRSRGTSLLSTAPVERFDGLGAFRFRSSYNTTPNTWATGAQVACEATENWNSSGRGSSLIFKVTKNNDTIPTNRLIMDGYGSTHVCNGDGNACLTVTPTGSVIIGGDMAASTTQYILPSVRSALTHTPMLADVAGNGTLDWIDLYNHHNYQTTTASPSVLYSATPSVMETPAGELTRVFVGIAGTYTATLTAEISLNGNLPQQLTARVTSVITELEGYTYTNFAAADWGASTTLTAGFYVHTGASGLSGNLTLNGSSTDTFVLHTIGALTTGASSNVFLTGGALAKNVFWITDGALTIGASSYMEGVHLAKAAVTLNASASMVGRLYVKDAGAASAVSFLTGSNINLYPPDTSPLITLGTPLSAYGVYNSWGSIARTGAVLAMHLPLLTGEGIISGFGAPYDGPYTSGVTQPTIWVDVMLYNNGVLVPVSMRCIRQPISDCYCVNIACDIVCAKEVYVDARIRVKIADTTSIVQNRCLNLTRVG